MSEPIYLLSAGASNLQQGEPNASGGASGEFNISPLVKVWNNRNNVTGSADLGDAWVSPVKGQRPYIGANKNPCWTHFADEVARKTGREVRHICVSKGGTEMAQWWTSSPQAMTARLLAVLAAAGVTRVDAFHWFHWSTTDETANNSSQYRTRYSALWSHLEGLGIVDALTAEIISEPAIGRPRGQNTMIDLWNQRGRDRCVLVPCHHMPTSGDNIHFNGGNSVRIGRMQAGAYSLLANRP